MILLLAAFALGVTEASFGMGYGTGLTPVLLLLGYDPLEVVPAVIASQLVGDLMAVFFHHQVKNVDLSLCGQHLRVAVTLSVMSLVGSALAVLLALNISTFALDLYIGILVAGTGLVVLFIGDKQRSFSWVRLLGLGAIAAFNKGISGGGYGPIVTAGQLVTGVEARAAVAITALAEGVTCIAAIAAYLLLGTHIEWTLAFWLSIGVTLSTPVAALLVRRMNNQALRVIIGIGTLLLGTLTIARTVVVF